MQHLPAPPAGLEYRTRTVQNDHGPGYFVTTGLFKTGGRTATLEQLQACPVLFVDFDLPKPRPEPGPALVAALDALYAQLWYALPLPPTAVVCSGYGYHIYWWLDKADWGDTAGVRSANEALVRSLAPAGADKDVFDAGTRILRLPGTMNRKQLEPTPCELVGLDPTLVYPLSAFPRAVRAALPPASVRAASWPAQIGSAAVVEGLGSALDALDVSGALEALRSDPFVAWCAAEPQAVKKRSWYGLATAIAATGREEGRALFHELSALDPRRYDPRSTDREYDLAMERILAGELPWTYAALKANGDWPGPPEGTPLGKASPANPRAADPVDASPDLSLDKEGKPYAVAANLRKILRTVQHQYRLNLMDSSVEFDGVAITDAHYGAVQEQLYDIYRAHFQRLDVINAVFETAAQNAYRPVQAYLEGLPAFTGPSTLPTLCRALGVEATPLHIRYLECFLIGAVRRGLCDDPRGVKHDTMLVLQGPQGAGKSTFFALLGGLWFSDTPITPGNKDAYDACRNHWLIEWPEIDRIKDHATTKAFITSQVDSWRRVFQVNEEKHPRRCVFVGTTNKDSFLNDDTGSRRYHVMRITRTIDHALIDRDRVWAEAVAMAAAGKPHWLTYEEDRARAASNADVQVEERWQWLVENWLAKARPDEVTINQVLEMAVQLPPERWAGTDLQEVGRILKRLGYERKNERRGGVQTWVYRLPEKLRLVEKALDSAK